MKACCTFLFSLFLIVLAMAQKTALESKEIVVVLGEHRLYAVVHKPLTNGQATTGLITASFDERSSTRLFSRPFHVSTGRHGMATPIGHTTVQSKERYGRALPEFGGGELPYVLRVHLYDPRQERVRRIDIHGYHSVPDFPASHGCIRLRVSDAKKLFAWADVGTKVTIVHKRPAWLPKV